MLFRSQRFLDLYNTTAHQGLLKERLTPPIPLHVLGESKGRLYPPPELVRTFAHALFVRTTNRYGCVTLHRSHFYVDQGVPQTPVLLWVSGEDLRAVYDQVLVSRVSLPRQPADASGHPPPPRAMVSQPVCCPAGAGRAGGAHAAGLYRGVASPVWAASRGRSVAGGAARALCRTPERLKEVERRIR